MKGEAWTGQGTLNIVLVDDLNIQGLNARFLSKDRPTDVMAFPFGEEKGGVWGEVYVSTDRAMAQASEYDVSYTHELSRLIIHGVLHLLGYDDSTVPQRRSMRAKESYYLDRFFKKENNER